MPSDLDAIRERIDSLDAEIVQLIAQRQAQVVAAGRVKVDEAAVRDPDRVEKVIRKVRSLATDLGASPDVVERTYRAMISGFIELELSVHEQSGDGPR